jgi:hypothetical protein
MKTKDAQEDRLDLASFVGAVSRWCDLTGNVPVLNLDRSKAKAELEAFTQHLDYLAQKKRRQQLTF